MFANVGSRMGAQRSNEEDDHDDPIERLLRSHWISSPMPEGWNSHVAPVPEPYGTGILTRHPLMPRRSV